MAKFEEAYEEYAKKVYGYLVGLTRNEFLAEEITQEVFFKAFLNIGNFKGDCSLYTWLCTIGKNIYLNDCKKKKLTELNEEIKLSDDSLESILEDKTQVKRIHKVLHTLQEPYKEVFSLKIFGELKFKDIGEIFGKSESWAKVTFYRAKDKIIERIGDSNV